MRYLWLFLFLVVVWLLVAFAAAARAALDARGDGEEPGGVTIVPYIAVPPPLMVAAAYAVDRAKAPIGTWTVGGAHALVGLVAAAYVIRSAIALRKGSGGAED